MKNHTLSQEFPEYVDKIVKLKFEDGLFKKMYVNYEEVNALIVHYENDEQNHTSDDHLTDLRKKRMLLKDEIYQYLHDL